jgi:cold shock CspA family protein
MTGEVINILEHQGYFFVRGEDGIEYFAHKTALRQCRWEDLVQGQRVDFDPSQHPLKGPRTDRVQPISSAAA